MSDGVRLPHTPTATASWPIDGWIAPSTSFSFEALQGRFLEGGIAQHVAIEAH